MIFSDPSWFWGFWGVLRGPPYVENHGRRQEAPKYPSGPSQMYSKPKKMGQNPLKGYYTPQKVSKKIIWGSQCILGSLGPPPNFNFNIPQLQLQLQLQLQIQPSRSTPISFLTIFWGKTHVFYVTPLPRALKTCFWSQICYFCKGSIFGGLGGAQSVI